jgi:hypothetical protein
VHALLMGFDPDCLPLVREALAPGPWPLMNGSRGDVVVLAGGRCMPPEAAAASFGRPFVPPKHWRGHCESGPVESAGEAHG